jgi:Trk K+ transport system NAD-binding subunit
VFAKEERILAERRITVQKRRKNISFVLYEYLYKPIVLVKATYKQLVILAMMFVWGAGVFTYFERLPLIPAFLASVSTITTIGLYVPNGGNFLTMNTSEAVLLIIMIIVSVGAGASIVQSAVGAMMTGELAQGEAEKRLISKLKSHVIIFGYNHLGRYVAEKMDEMNVPYVVVQKDPQTHHALLNQKVLSVLERETHPLEALRQAGIEKASTVIVCHASDSENMMVVLSVKKLKSDVRVVCVVHNSDLIETAKNAGADVIISSSVTVGHLLALSAITKDLVGIVFSEKIGTKEIGQFSIFKSSKLIGRGLREVARYVTIIGVVRDDMVARDIFDPSFRLRENDVLLVLGDPSSLNVLEQQAEAR